MAATGWRTFWDRGGWWKALLVAAVYLAVLQLIGLLAGLVPGAATSTDQVMSSPQTVLIHVVAPPLLGAIVILLFAASVGWLPKPMFGRQPVSGRRWMWIGPGLVAVAAIFHFVGTDYRPYSAALVLAILAMGVVVGLSEEMITRGIAVILLRRSGHREWFVMVGSSLIFALLHIGNVLSGLPVSTVAVTVVYTFGFGINMYLALRVGGRLIWPILLHAVTDPSTFLASGGIDHAVASTDNTAMLIATVATFGYCAFAIVALIAVRGDAHGRAEADEPAEQRPPAHQPAT